MARRQTKKSFSSIPLEDDDKVSKYSMGKEYLIQLIATIMEEVL